jgi:DNA polymerase III sliding clamp (beta) subunit (PCNA family)
MNEFSVDGPALRRALVTALPFGGTDPTLPALQAVHIAAGPDQIEVTATDRYVLSLETLPVIAGTPFTVDVPRDVAKRIIAMLPKKHTHHAEASVAEFGSIDDRVRVTVAGLGVDQSITFHPQDTGFPDLHKVIDNLTANAVTEMHLTPAIVTRVMRTIRRRRGNAPVRVEFHGEQKPLVISHGDTFRCLLMPVKKPTDD